MGSTKDKEELTLTTKETFPSLPTLDALWDGLSAPKVKGYAYSSIFNLVFNQEELKTPAKSPDGVEVSIQEAISFLQSQGRVLEKIFSLVTRLEEMVFDYEAEEDGDAFAEQVAEEFDFIRGYLNEDLRSKFNDSDLFCTHAQLDYVRLTGVSESRGVNVAQYNVHEFIAPLIETLSLSMLDSSSIRRVANVISEFIGKASAAEIDLRRRFQLLAYGGDDENGPASKNIETRTTWMRVMLTRSDPFHVQGNLNSDTFSGLLG